MIEKRVALLEREQVAQFWPGLRARMLERPQAWADATPEETLLQALQGMKQMWALVNELNTLDAILISELRPSARGLTLYVSGAWREDFDEYIAPLAAAMSQVSERLGVEYFEIEGRPGWVRKLRKLGFVLERVTMLKEAKRTLN